MSNGPVLRDLVRQVDRRLWTRLQQLSDESIEAAVKPPLGRYEVKALLERRRKLVSLIRERIAERGEAAVLFDMKVPAQGRE